MCQRPSYLKRMNRFILNQLSPRWKVGHKHKGWITSTAISTTLDHHVSPCLYQSVILSVILHFYLAYHL